MGQLLGGDGAMSGNGLTIETDEMGDAEMVYISIVGDAMTGEILAEVCAVGANRLGKLEEGQVVLQVEPGVYAILL